nr:L-ascorbate oxidase homolog [Tanacetum cinerariifolium]
ISTTRGEHRSKDRTGPAKTGPDRDRVGPRLRTEDRTEMVRSGPGQSGPGRLQSGPVLHGIIFEFLVRSDRTEDRIGTKPQTEDRTEIRSVGSGRAAGGFEAVNIRARAVIFVPHLKPVEEFNALISDWWNELT